MSAPQLHHQHHHPGLVPDQDLVIGPQHKAFPPALWGSTVGDLAANPPALADLTTPVLVLDSAIVDHNLDAMRRWTRARDLELAPHGKTTMAPRLWQRMVDHGAIALTLATPWQVEVARAAGVGAVMLANTLVDPSGIRWLSAELDADPSFELCTWVDGREAVEVLETVRVAAGAERPLDVIVELGGPGGRTGARSLEEALAVATAVAESSTLRLVGCGGYEGALAHDRSERGLAAVRGYLEDVARLHAALADARLYDLGNRPRALVTAGGSAYFDVVAEVLGALVDPRGEHGTPTSVVLRSGAYLIHDDGFYRQISPLDGAASPADAGGPRFASAMHAFVRIVSRPEPGLALFDAGKRDLPFDEGLPVPRAVVGLGAEASAAALEGAEVTSLNDQHGFLRVGPGGEDTLAVGTVLRLGLSHPCTALDKWRLVPLVDDHAAEAPCVVDAVATYF